MFYGHRILPAGRAAGFSSEATGALGTATLGLVGFGTGVTVEFGELEGSYGVSLPTLGPLELHIGADEFMASPDAAAIIGRRSAISDGPGTHLPALSCAVT